MRIQTLVNDIVDFIDTTQDAGGFDDNLEMIIRNNFKDFLNAIWSMRKYQKLFKENKDTRTENAADHYAKRVDEHLTALQKEKEEPTLKM